MNAIVSVTSDWGIGNEGRLLVRNKDDMRRFVDLTMGGAVLMGRSTFESFPGGALKGRRNVVLTRQDGYAAEGIETYSQADEAIAALASEDPDRVWLIGGETVYHELLPHCTRAYVTKNDVALPADAFFPNLDEDPHWQIEETLEGGITKAGIPFEYVTYRNLRKMS
ncbi:MAG: dihydrofolate reductase [Olsenella sp.]|nr:dihydrofolate reductase [Olsenella sp.]